MADIGDFCRSPEWAVLILPGPRLCAAVEECSGLATTEYRHCVGRNLATMKFELVASPARGSDRALRTHPRRVKAAASASHSEAAATLKPTQMFAPGTGQCAAICGLERRTFKSGRRLYAKAGLRPLKHRSSRPNLGLPNGPRRLDVDDHTVVGVDQIVGGVGEESMPLMCAGALGCRIRSGNELRRHWQGCAERRVVESGKVLLRGSGRGFL
jgi:hypothetical protein